jgi:hypothetical protein
MDRRIVLQEILRTNRLPSFNKKRIAQKTKISGEGGVPLVGWVGGTDTENKMMSQASFYRVGQTQLGSF